jgi:hypothetical protein
MQAPLPAHDLAQLVARRLARTKSGMLAILALGAVVWMFALIGIFSVTPSGSPWSLTSPVSLLSDAVISGLPEFPGARRSEFREEVFGDERVTEIEYLVDSGIPAVREHYRAALAEGGWTVTDTNWVHGELVFTVSSGARHGVVEIEHREGVTEVEVEMVEPTTAQVGLGR